MGQPMNQKLIGLIEDTHGGETNCEHNDEEVLSPSQPMRLAVPRTPLGMVAQMMRKLRKADLEKLTGFGREALARQCPRRRR